MLTRSQTHGHLNPTSLWHFKSIFPFIATNPPDLCPTFMKLDFVVNYKVEWIVSLNHGSRCSNLFSGMEIWESVSACQDGLVSI